MILFSLTSRRAGWLCGAVFSAFLVILLGTQNPAMARGVETYPGHKLVSGKKKLKNRRRSGRKGAFLRRGARKHISGKHVSKRALRRPPSRRLHKITKPRRVSMPRTRGLNPRLRTLLAQVQRHYGRPLIITSGCRSHRHNRRVGGARHSMHLLCKAADFKVAGVSKSALRRYVLGLPGRGGVGTYCGRSIVHLDVGPRRSWYYGCRKRRRRG